ncbi:hypothetical protein [Sphingomonas sp. DC1100-1]
MTAATRALPFPRRSLRGWMQAADVRWAYVALLVALCRCSGRASIM